MHIKLIKASLTGILFYLLNLSKSLNITYRKVNGSEISKNNAVVVKRIFKDGLLCNIKYLILAKFIFSPSNKKN